MKKTVGVLVLLLLVSGGNAITQRTSVSGDFPIYNNLGRPDLTIDPQRVVAQMSIIDRVFDQNSCSLQEGHVGGSGVRRLLRFDTVIMNTGDGDLVVGDRSDPGNPYADWFYFSACHGHYHIRDFSSYELLNSDRTIVAAGHKQGFCFEDSLKYDGGKSQATTAGTRESRRGGAIGTTNSSTASGSTSPVFRRAITSCV